MPVSRPGTVYAANADVGSLGAGILVSTDGGASWARMNRGLINANVLTLAVDPAGSTLLAGTWGNGAFLSSP